METTLQPHAPAGSTDDRAPGSGHGSPHRTWLSLAVSEGSRWLVVAFTVTLLIIINYEVFARYLFNAPTVWVTEYSTYLVAAMAFLGAAFAVVRDSHIRVTLLLDAVSGTRRQRLDQLSAATALLVTLVLAWKSLEFVHGEFAAGTRDFGLMATPMWVPQSVVALGYLGLLLALALQVRQQGGRLGGWRCALGVVSLALATTVLYGHSLGLLPLSPWWGLCGCGAGGRGRLGRLGRGGKVAGVCLCARGGVRLECRCPLAVAGHGVGADHAVPAVCWRARGVCADAVGFAGGGLLAAIAHAAGPGRAVVVGGAHF
ncbi:MAG: hypothetical protein C0449_17385 [Polaromonas sp.]|nr:hypothetical protein [Polaromonas sp.]MBA4256735.1 hypothetical protein [Polaromonas sp.]